MTRSSAVAGQTQNPADPFIWKSGPRIRISPILKLCVTASLSTGRDCELQVVDLREFPDGVSPWLLGSVIRSCQGYGRTWPVNTCKSTMVVDFLAGPQGSSVSWLQPLWVLRYQMCTILAAMCVHLDAFWFVYAVRTLLRVASRPLLDVPSAWAWMDVQQQQSNFGSKTGWHRMSTLRVSVDHGG